MKVSGILKLFIPVVQLEFNRIVAKGFRQGLESGAIKKVQTDVVNKATSKAVAKSPALKNAQSMMKRKMYGAFDKANQSLFSRKLHDDQTRNLG